MKGFTLIELMVAVSVGLVVTGMVIVNYNSYNTIQALKQAALTLKNDIRFVETKASTGVKPSGICSTLVGWNMTFTANGYTYTANCDGTPSTDVTTVSYPAGVTMTTFPTPATVTFFVLSKGTSLASDATLTLLSGSKTYILYLGKNGDVSDRGFQ